MTDQQPEEFHDESGLFALQPLPDSTVAALSQISEMEKNGQDVSLEDLLALKRAAQRAEDAGTLDLNALMGSALDAVERADEQAASNEDVDLEALWDAS